jgi:hypothetical protein
MTWLIAAFDSVIGLLHSVDVADDRMSEVHVTSSSWWKCLMWLSLKQTEI